MAAEASPPDEVLLTLARVGDTGAEPEAKLRARLLTPSGAIPQSGPVKLTSTAAKVVLTAPDGASIRYRLDKEGWQLYSAPLDMAQLAGKELQAEAVRYGYEAGPVLQQQF